MGAPLICPINAGLADHGGLCIREQCEWWVKGDERTDMVRDPYGEDCSPHSEELKGPYGEGGACAIKAIAVETHDVDVRLRHLDRDLTCINKTLNEHLVGIYGALGEIASNLSKPSTP